MPDAFIETLTEYLLGGRSRQKTHAKAAAAAELAPPPLKSLFRAMATHWRREISLHHKRLLGVDYEDFSGVLDAAGIAEGSDDWFDPARSLVIGQMAGGETYCGLVWSGDQVRFVEVDIEGGTAQSFDTGKAYLEDVLSDVEAFRVHAGIEPELADLLRSIGVSVDPDVPMITEYIHDVKSFTRHTEARLTSKLAVTVQDGEIRVTRSDGTVVASAPFSGSKVFVAHGRIFGLIEEYSFADAESFAYEEEHGYAVWRWDGKALHDEGTTRVGHDEDDPAEPNLFNVSAKTGGDLVIGVDDGDEILWYRYSPRP